MFACGTSCFTNDFNRWVVSVHGYWVSIELELEVTDSPYHCQSLKFCDSALCSCGKRLPYATGCILLSCSCERIAPKSCMLTSVSKMYGWSTEGYESTGAWVNFCLRWSKAVSSGNHFPTQTVHSFWSGSVEVEWSWQSWLRGFCKMSWDL